jgi:hypothetical protein
MFRLSFDPVASLLLFDQKFRIMAFVHTGETREVPFLPPGSAGRHGTSNGIK